MPGITMPITGVTLSRVLKEVAAGRIPVERLTLRAQNGKRIPVKRVVRQGSRVIVDA